MHILLKCQIFRRRQRHLWRDQTLHNRIIGQIQKHRDMGTRPALLKRPPEILCDIVFYTHRGKYDRKFSRAAVSGILPQARLFHNLRRQLIVRQSVSGKNRQFLPSDQRGQSVNRGNPGADIIARILPGTGVHRLPVHIPVYLGPHRSKAVDGPAEPA